MPFYAKVLWFIFSRALKEFSSVKQKKGYSLYSQILFVEKSTACIYIYVYGPVAGAGSSLGP